MTDEALNAIAVYRLSLKPAEQQWPPALASNDVRMTAGQAIYKDTCAACHTDAGTGATGLFPRLAGSPAVQSDDPTTLIRTVLFGSQAAATPDAPTAPAMPSFAWRLSNTQTAAVITYIRNAWGNAAAAVSPNQVQTIRGK
jgi:mono/diheme cytochrome c family protein